MTKIVHPDETLNIYYRVSEDTEELEDIVKIERNDDKKEISDLPDLQNTKIIQWSPDSEHEGEEFEFNIDGISEIQEIYVSDILKNEIYQKDDWGDEKFTERLNTQSREQKIENNMYNTTYRPSWNKKQVRPQLIKMKKRIYHLRVEMALQQNLIFGKKIWLRVGLLE